MLLGDQLVEGGGVEPGAPLHPGQLLGDEDVDAVRLPAHRLVDPAQLDVELLRAVDGGAEHAEPAAPGDGGHDVAAMAEGEDGVLDAELVADAGAHGITVGRRRVALPAREPTAAGLWGRAVGADGGSRHGRRARCGLDDPDVLVGWTVEELPWLAAMPPGRVTSMSAGYRLGRGHRRRRGATPGRRRSRRCPAGWPVRSGRTSPSWRVARRGRASSSGRAWAGRTPPPGSPGGASSSTSGPGCRPTTRRPSPARSWPWSKARPLPLSPAGRPPTADRGRRSGPRWRR